MCLLVLRMCPFPLDNGSHPFIFIIHSMRVMFPAFFYSILVLILFSCPVPEFVNLLRNPGIDFQAGGPGRQSYFTYRPAWVHRLVESIPGLPNRVQFRALPVLEFYNDQWELGTE
jgi:hypothetical protein